MTHKEIIPMHKDTYFFGYGIDIENPIELAHKIIEQKEEIERLNNIINELEKELNKDFNTYMTNNRQIGKVYKAGADNYRMHIYLRLQKLKGSDKE